MKARPLASLVVVATLAFVSGCRDDKGHGGGSGKPKSTVTTPAPTGSGVIAGTVKLAGAPPASQPWGGSTFQGCTGKHPTDIQVVRAPGGLLEDAFVYVKDGLPPGTYTSPTTPVVVDQKACEFAPRVFAAMAEQPVKWANGDNLMHNINTGQFNVPLMAGANPLVKPLDATGSPMVAIRCDVHPWMRAYAGVMEHPYFQVTGPGGAYKLSGLVDGNYTVAVWHEWPGSPGSITQEQKVTVTSAAPATLDFEMKAP